MLSRIPLPNTDLIVSQICYGTNLLGYSVDKELSFALLDRFYEIGGTFIDSGRVYGGGNSEAMVAAWLKERGHKDMVVATKGLWRDANFRSRFTVADLEDDLHTSLRELNVDTIDFYWLHTDDNFDPRAPEDDPIADQRPLPFEPIVDALIAAKRAGKIRWFGGANWSPQRLSAANAYAAQQGSEGFVAVQPFGGLAKPNRPAASEEGYGQHYEEDFAINRVKGLESTHAAGLPMVPYTSQSFGFFAVMEQGGVDALNPFLRKMYLNDLNLRRAQIAQDIAKDKGSSAHEVALAYLLEQPLPTFPIVGTSNLDRFAEMERADKLTLTPDELARLKTG